MKRDWDNFFRPEDFKIKKVDDPPWGSAYVFNETMAADQANKILREEIEKLTTVYGEVSFGSFSGLPDKWTIDADPHNSHTTKILPPKEIG